METVNTYKHEDSDVTIMVNEDGEFFYCVSGMDKGLYWESEDIGGFATQEEAEADVPEYFVRFNQEA